MRGNLTRLLANHCAVRAFISAPPPARRRLDRRFWTTTALALVFSSLGVSTPALALDECGPLNASGSATCFPTVDNYPTGINYNTENGLGGTPISVRLLPLGGVPVRVIIGSGTGVVNAVNLANTVAGPLTNSPITLTAIDAIIDNTANPLDPNKSGLRIQASGSAIIIANGTTVDVAGAQSTNAIWAISLGNDVGAVAAVTYDGPGVTSIGTTFSTAIQAQNDGPGASIIDAAGNITGVALGAAANGVSGLFARGGSSGTVNYSRGTIDVRGIFANGIFALGDSATVTTDPGTSIIVTSTGGPLKPGIAVDSFGQPATVNAASTIQMLGPAAPDPDFRDNGFGIRATGSFGSPISVTLTDQGSITTEGGNGIGIAALSPPFGGRADPSPLQPRVQSLRRALKRTASGRTRLPAR
jgi:hypothetical protein